MKDAHKFPVRFGSKVYTEDECNDIYRAFYNKPSQLSSNGGIKVTDRMVTYPDGSIRYW